MSHQAVHAIRVYKISNSNSCSSRFDSLTAMQEDISAYNKQSWRTVQKTAYCLAFDLYGYRPMSFVQGMTLNCINIFIVTGSFLYRCVMRPASQRFFIHMQLYLWILIISYLATFLGTNTNSLSVLMCRKAVNQSIIYGCPTKATGS